ncbi:MAG: hypothetical protein ABR604_07590, partial [Jatrophihabitantaceae bacterium]
MAQAKPREVDTSSSRVVPGTGRPTGSSGWLSRLAVASPELVASAVAGFSLGPMVLLLAGAFTAPVALSLGLVGAGAAMALAGLPNEPVPRSTLVFTGAAALVALAWFAYNVRYYAQDVYATRDPATYGLAARWLMDHASLNIPVHAEVFGTPAGATPKSGG